MRYSEDRDRLYSSLAVLWALAVFTMLITAVFTENLMWAGIGFVLFIAGSVYGLVVHNK